jgi:hypothetical protein
MVETEIVCKQVRNCEEIENKRKSKSIADTSLRYVSRVYDTRTMHTNNVCML